MDDYNKEFVDIVTHMGQDTVYAQHIKSLEQRIEDNDKHTFSSVLGEAVLFTIDRLYLYASDFSMRLFFPEYPTPLEIQESPPSYSKKAKERVGKVAFATGTAALWMLFS